MVLPLFAAALRYSPLRLLFVGELSRAFQSGGVGMDNRNHAANGKPMKGRSGVTPL